LAAVSVSPIPRQCPPVIARHVIRCFAEMRVTPWNCHEEVMVIHSLNDVASNICQDLLRGTTAQWSTVACPRRWASGPRARASTPPLPTSAATVAATRRSPSTLKRCTRDLCVSSFLRRGRGRRISEFQAKAEVVLYFCVRWEEAESLVYVGERKERDTIAHLCFALDPRRRVLSNE